MTSRIGCWFLQRSAANFTSYGVRPFSLCCQRWAEPATAENTTDTSAAPATAAPPTEAELALPEYRFVFPEFLPPANVEWRNKLKEKLERRDMIHRRSHIDIPEFYVGSVMAVTVSDAEAPGMTSRFVGICILREETGLKACFTLRNVIEQQGIEITYPLYNPTLQRIEVLVLEKRLDDDLRYLRDAPPEYSTFAQDLQPSTASLTTSVTVNPLKVPLNPRPWTWRWERCQLRGAELPPLRPDFYERAKKVAQPWLRYDLMHEYRRSISEADQRTVYADVHAHLQQRAADQQQTQRAKRVFVPPQKTA